MLSIATRILAGLAALVHVMIFSFESLLWLNPDIYSRFLVQNAAEAQTLQLFAYNQGWYNLFLALGCGAGVWLWNRWHPHVGRTLIVYTCTFMVGAAVVLITSEPLMSRAAVTQGLFPALALLLFWLDNR